MGRSTVLQVFLVKLNINIWGNRIPGFHSFFHGLEWKETGIQIGKVINKKKDSEIIFLAMLEYPSVDHCSLQSYFYELVLVSSFHFW